MRRIFTPFVILLSALFMLTSCLGDDDSEVVYYGDTAVSSFTLGTLNRYLHTTTAAGADSIYMTTFSGATYTMYIDQLNHEIYNADSLPTGTDAAHVLCTIGTRNGGTAVWKSLTSDSLRTYSASDSVDLSALRELRVYAADGSGYRAYQVRLNVHKDEADVFHWTACGSQPVLSSVENMRAVNADGRLYVYGTEGDTDVCYATSLTDGTTWEKATRPVNADITIADAPTTDAYWPTQDINLVRLPKKTNADTWQLVLVGNRSVADYPDDTTAVVWGRVDEQTDGSEQQPWIYQEFSADNRYRLPRMEHLQMVAYNGWVVALGGNPLGASTSQAFSQLYVSRDAGLTWKSDSLLPLPDGFASSSSSFALAADDNGFLWIICGGSGQVWRGRLSQLGWQQ